MKTYTATIKSTKTGVEDFTYGFLVAQENPTYQELRNAFIATWGNRIKLSGERINEAVFNAN